MHKSKIVLLPLRRIWGIASRLRPDSRLSMNQTMVAIYEANPDPFEGNFNELKAGSTLRAYCKIPAH